MIAQLRGWLPDPIGGIYWVFLDNAYTSPYVPIYAGTQEIAECYKNFDPTTYSNKSACWAIDFVDNLLYLKWQEAVKDLWAVRDPYRGTAILLNGIMWTMKHWSYIRRTRKRPWNT